MTGTASTQTTPVVSEQTKALLDSRDLRVEFGFGRDLALALQKRLPHIKVGRSGKAARLLIHRIDLEALLRKASLEGADLWELVRRFDNLMLWVTEGNSSEPHTA